MEIDLKITSQEISKSKLEGIVQFLKELPIGIDTTDKEILEIQIEDGRINVYPSYNKVSYNLSLGELKDSNKIGNDIIPGKYGILITNKESGDFYHLNFEPKN